jgi:hypothetical protein
MFQMRIGLFEQLAPDGLTCAAFEKDVVGHNNRGATVLLQDGEDVLGEVEQIH